MSSFGPYATEAHRLEQDNIQMRREIDELREALDKKSRKLEQAISELRVTKERLSRSSSASDYNKEETNYKKYIRELEEENEYLRSKSSCKCCCCCCCKCDPMRGFDRAEESLKKLVNKYQLLKEDYEHLANENKQWSDFCYFIYGVASTNLQYFPEFPENSPETQRKIVSSLIRKVCKVGCKEISEHAEFENLKNKYSKITKGISTIHYECDNLDGILNDYPSFYNRKTGEISRIEDKVFNDSDSSKKRKNYTRYEYTVEKTTTKKNVSPSDISRNIKKAEEKIENIESAANINRSSLKSNLRKLHSATKSLKEDYNRLADLDRE